MTSPNSYEPGNAVILQGVFTDLTGNPVNPTTVICRTRDPAYALVTYSGSSVTQVGVGIYEVTITPALPGVWYYRFEGTGAVIAGGEFKFEIKPSIFPAD